VGIASSLVAYGEYSINRERKSAIGGNVADKITRRHIPVREPLIKFAWPSRGRSRWNRFDPEGIGSMRQTTLASAGFGKCSKTTRRAAFLAEMEQVVPWKALYGLIEPHYPKAGDGRHPIGVDRMLRIYLLQQWFNLSDPGAEEALYDSVTVRRHCQINRCRSRVALNM
jgi:hypothetical protein